MGLGKELSIKNPVGDGHLIVLSLPPPPYRWGSKKAFLKACCLRKQDGTLTLHPKHPTPAPSPSPNARPPSYLVPATLGAVFSGGWSCLLMPMAEIG